MLTDNNNLQQFMDIKIMSSKYVCLAQKLLRCYFWIDYYEEKANRVVDFLSQYP